MNLPVHCGTGMNLSYGTMEEIRFVIAISDENESSLCSQCYILRSTQECQKTRVQWSIKRRSNFSICIHIGSVSASFKRFTTLRSTSKQSGVAQVWAKRKNKYICVCVFLCEMSCVVQHIHAGQWI